MELHRKALQLLHHHVWQRLPPKLRRAALTRATSLLAARPDREIEAAEFVFVVGVLRTASGLGESARLCYEALRRLGVETFGVDMASALMQPVELPHYAFKDGRSHIGPGTVILHVNGPLVSLALMRLGRDFLERKRIIGYWAWELEHTPSEWRSGVPFVHEIWVPSRFTANAVADVATATPIRIVPHPVSVRPHTAASKQASAFRVLMVFNVQSGFERKNPCAAISAFRRAFGDDPSCELVVRSSRLEGYPPGRGLIDAAIEGQKNIRHLAGVMPAGELDDHYAAADAVISLHRAEGFGLVLAEAMLRGLPVVATDWSGNVDFMNESNSCPVRCTLVPAHDPQRVYDYPQWHWAEPDIDHAAELLRRLRDDTHYRLQIGQKAAQDAADLFSLNAYAVHARALLGAAVPAPTTAVE